MIFGLSGYGQSGKDTAAAFLVQELGFKKIAWADALREALVILNPRVQYAEGKEYHDLADALKWYGYESMKAHSPHYRGLLQRMGTDVGRMLLGENVWVDATMRRINAEPEQERWVIADTRFPNEADAIRNTGGRIFRITRFGVCPVNDHPSETALNGYPFDHVIFNNEGLDDFRYAVVSTARSFL